MDAYADTITEEMNKGSFIPDARARAANEIRTSLFALREFKKVIDDEKSVPAGAKAAHAELRRATDELIAAREEAIGVLFNDSRDATGEIRAMLHSHLKWVHALRDATEKANFKEKDKADLDKVIASLEAQVTKILNEFDMEEDQAMRDMQQRASEAAVSAERDRLANLEQARRAKQEAAQREQTRLQEEEMARQEEVRRQQEEAARQNEGSQNPPPTGEQGGAPPAGEGGGTIQSPPPDAAGS